MGRMGQQMSQEPLKRHSISWYAGNSHDHIEPMQIVEIPCFHCGKRTRMSAPSIINAHDDHWKERFEKLMASLNDAVKLCNLKYGTDPMREEFMKWLLKIREEHGLDSKGEEWKRGKAK